MASQSSIPLTVPTVPAPGTVEKLKRNWAKGRRLDFLTSHLDGYSAASVEGSSRAQDYIDNVVNGYFRFFPWRLSTTEEPPAEATPTDDIEILTVAEAEQKRLKVQAMRKAIRSWLDYRTTTNRKVGRHANPENDPWARLLSQLSGVSPKKPKALQAHQRWSKDHFLTVVKEDFDRRCASEGITGKAQTNFRDRVTREQFLKRPEAERTRYAELAKREAQEASDSWLKALGSPPSTDPVARQEAIDRLSVFAGPLLAGMHDILGMHITLLVGGPEPRKGGRITVLSMHEGGDKQPIPRNWQQYDKEKFKEVTRAFQEYLLSCYTEDERNARKLSDDCSTNATLFGGDMDTLTPDPPSASRQTLSRPKKKYRSRNQEAVSSGTEFDRESDPGRGSSDENDNEKEDGEDDEDEDGENDKDDEDGDEVVNRPGHRRREPLPFSARQVDYVFTGPNRMTAVPRQKAKRAGVPRRKVTSRARRAGGDLNAAANDGDDPPRSEEGHQNEHPQNEALSSDALPRNEPRDQSAQSHAQPDALLSQDEPPQPSAHQDGPSRPTDSAPTSPVVPTLNAPHHPSPADDRGDSNQQRRAPSSNSVPPRENDGLSRDPEHRDRASGNYDDSDLQRQHQDQAYCPPTSDDNGSSAPQRENDAPLSLEGCPDWFSRACGYLATIPARDHFRQLPPVFQELEHSSDFSTEKGAVHALGNKNRPEAIHWWISRARTGQPPIQVRRFSEQFWVWWSSLQPSWRVLPTPAEGEPFQHPCSVEGDWSVLDKPGLNGFYSVIAALGWWGAALTDSSSDWEVSFWETAVDDVKWTMQQIVRSRNTRKRVAPPSTDGQGGTKRSRR